MRQRAFSYGNRTDRAWSLWLWFGLGAFLVAVTFGMAMAAEQPPAAPAEAAPVLPEPAVEVPLPVDQAVAAPPPAAAAPATAAAEAAPSPAAAAGGESLLSWLYNSLGLMYSVAFLFLSFTGVALVVMNILQLRRDNFIPAALVDGFESHLNEKRYQEAYDLAKGDESFMGQVLSAGLAKLNQGYEHSIEAMQEVGEEENMKLQQRLGYLALIGTISPMVGLLGTVDGMVKSFSVIAQSTTQPKPSDLAHGIELALVTTLVGLQIAIPAIAIYNILKNRLDRLVLQVGIKSEGLMSRFSTVGSKK